MDITLMWRIETRLASKIEVRPHPPCLCLLHFSQEHTKNSYRKSAFCKVSSGENSFHIFWILVNFSPGSKGRLQPGHSIFNSGQTSHLKRFIVYLWLMLLFRPGTHNRKCCARKSPPLSVSVLLSHALCLPPSLVFPLLNIPAPPRFRRSHHMSVLGIMVNEAE